MTCLKRRRIQVPPIIAGRFGVVFALSDGWKILDGRHAPVGRPHLDGRRRREVVGRAVLVAPARCPRRQRSARRPELGQAILYDNIAGTTPDLARLVLLRVARLRSDCL
jgi:hypothetical protein